eukprot:scaffold63513_cov35-Attheya_sp.AAC.1
MVSSLDIDGDVQDMAGGEWLLDMIGSYIRNQDVECMGKRTWVRVRVAWRHGRFGLFIGNQDVKGMKGCEWVELRCRGHGRLCEYLKHGQFNR